MSGTVTQKETQTNLCSALILYDIILKKDMNIGCLQGSSVEPTPNFLSKIRGKGFLV